MVEMTRLLREARARELEGRADAEDARDLRDPREPRDGRDPRDLRPGRRGVSSFVVILALLAGVFVGVRGFDLLGLPSLHNPFSSRTTERTAPPLLKSLSDLSRYQAATGDFQVLVDVEHDVAHIPTILKGQRTLFQAQGTVDAYVEFGTIGDSAIVTSPDGKGVTVTLPPPTLSVPRVDPEASRVISRRRGVLDRLGGVLSDNPTSDKELYLAAQDKMAGAAQSGGLKERAEDNTRKMLEKMLGKLGYTDVTVKFEPDARP